jgi:hypothetical protein
MRFSPRTVTHSSLPFRVKVGSCGSQPTRMPLDRSSLLVFSRACGFVGCQSRSGARVDQINVAGATSRRGHEVIVGRRRGAVDGDRPVVERLMDHGRMGWDRATRDKAERRAWVFVEARQVDRGLDRIGAGIDDTERVGILVADKYAIPSLRHRSRDLRERG